MRARCSASATYASVSGGRVNTASVEEAAWIGGGYKNTASGENASVGGGKFNAAEAELSSVSGGAENAAAVEEKNSGLEAWIGGGLKNKAAFKFSAIFVEKNRRRKPNPKPSHRALHQAKRENCADRK